MKIEVNLNYCTFTFEINTNAESVQWCRRNANNFTKKHEIFANPIYRQLFNLSFTCIVNWFSFIVRKTKSKLAVFKKWSIFQNFSWVDQQRHELCCDIKIKILLFFSSYVVIFLFYSKSLITKYVNFKSMRKWCFLVRYL